MKTILAIAPNGGAAAQVKTERVASSIEGAGYDPFGDTWHWTGRRPYERAEQKGYVLQQKADDWVPKDTEELAKDLKPAVTVTLPQDAGGAGTTVAQAIAQLPREHRYLMAMAAATVILRNMTNGIATYTFHDGSQAYVDTREMEVTPVN